jgi:diacylglycerol kinase (ATP)
MDRKPTSFFKSCECAYKGIVYSFKTERHLRFHFFTALLVIVLGFFFNLKVQEWLFIIYAIGSVIAAELFNTALERVVDLTKPGYHHLAALAKDIAAGAVLVTTVQAVIIGTIIFGPYIF